MEILKVLLLIVEVVCCLLLIGVILLQKSKSEGLGMAFGAGMGESLFGSRAGNVLSKITVILSIVFLVNTLGLALIYSGAAKASGESSLVTDAAGPAAPAIPGLDPNSGAAVPVGTVELPAAPVEQAADDELPKTE